ncbi:hypothetical protein ABTW72_24335 [Micromonospora sp. NPDC127501]|uniref:hypothetical protein n=1 Tax=Micromonospora sp. NPDC127501 TaxID=3154872 RepID=UPI00331A449E
MQARVGVAAATISVALAGLTGPASAVGATSDRTAAVVVGGSATMAAGELGMCYKLPNPANSRSGGGFCDGTGPDARYYGRVTCSNGMNYYGPERWAGDTRNSYGTCPSGTSRASWGVYGYYV